MDHSKIDIYQNYISQQYPKAFTYFSNFVTEHSWSAEKQAKHSLTISGSKIGAIANKSKWHSPLDVFLAMTLQKEPFTGNAKTRRGQALEHEIAYEASEILQGKLGGGMELVYPEFNGFTCQIDETLKTPLLGVVLVECKWISSFITNDWGKGSIIDAGGNIVTEDSQIPSDYFAQVQWQLGICNAVYKDKASKMAILSAVIRNEPAPRLYVIHFDEEYFNELLAKAEDFLFNHIITNTAPEMTEQEIQQMQSNANKKAKTETGDMLTLEGDAEKSLFEDSVRYSALNAQITELKKELEEVKLRIIGSIGDHEGVMAYGNVVATYKTSKDKIKFNEKLFAAKEPELYEQYCEVVAGSRIFSNKL